MYVYKRCWNLLFFFSLSLVKRKIDLGRASFTSFVRPWCTVDKPNIFKERLESKLKQKKSKRKKKKRSRN
jgi:hypothetical protein